MSHSTQRSRILALLIGARGGEVGLPEILALGIAQFGARIKELRALGFDISNRQETVEGQKHSWYRLISMPALHQVNQQLQESPADAEGLFGDIGPDRSYRE